MYACLSRILNPPAASSVALLGLTRRSTRTCLLASRLARPLDVQTYTIVSTVKRELSTMIYRIGNTTIDSNKYRDSFAKRYYLPFMKEIMSMSGCSLKEAKELIEKVIQEQGIEVDPVYEEIQNYCRAEYEDQSD